MQRRQMLGMAMALVAPAARAAAWPERPIRMLIPFAPGSSADVLGRLIAEPLGARLGQPIISENRAGAAGSIAAEAAARMAPDGYGLFLGTIGTQAVNRHLYSRLAYDADRDFAPISHLWNAVNVMAVATAAPYRNVQDVVAAGRQRRLNFGSPGTGTSDHMASSLFGIRAGVELEHIPYRGGSAAVQLDLIAGRLDFTIGNLPALAAGLQGGTIRPLAVAYPRRWPTIPEVPTMAEAGVAGVEVPTWHAMLGPKGLDPAIRDRLAAELRAVLLAPAMRARLLELGTEPVASDPAGLLAWTAQESAKYGELVRRLGIKGE